MSSASVVFTVKTYILGLNELMLELGVFVKFQLETFDLTKTEYNVSTIHCQ